MAWRAMRQEDLAQACAIADEVHAAHPEDPEVFAERLALYPGGCLVLESGGRVAGYALAHPWMRAALQELAALAAREALPILALVAIPGTRAFWHGQGFAVVERPALAAKLASYGTGARFMERPARR
ncbi:MAG: GNAT family N-acetyltransferase [Alphaproteobacteria bacterium]|nr:GNAT family N-acetyltransferase [Alphaproteobacteria bacterium]